LLTVSLDSATLEKFPHVTFLRRVWQAPALDNQRLARSLGARISAKPQSTSGPVRCVPARARGAERGAFAAVGD
jgi:hypothetical protein